MTKHDEQKIIIAKLTYGTTWNVYQHFKKMNDHEMVKHFRDCLGLEDESND